MGPGSTHESTKGNRASMKMQILDSGISVPAKKEEPKAIDTVDIRERMRIDAGFPKVIKVTIGETSCRVFIKGNHVYDEYENCKDSEKIKNE